MSRRSRDADILAVFALVVTLVVAWTAAEVGQRLRAAGAVTAAAPTPTPAAVAVMPAAAPTTCPTAQAPQHNQKTEVLPVRMAEPLMFECPDGGILVPWNINWDAEPHECLRKLWALRSREGALHPLYSRYRRDRCHAAWVACPERFRR